MCVWASIIPGIPVKRLRSMTSAPAGARPFARTVVILSFSTTTTALLMTLRPSHSFPNLMAFVAAIALIDTVSKKIIRNNLTRTRIPLLPDLDVLSQVVCADVGGEDGAHTIRRNAGRRR